MALALKINRGLVTVNGFRFVAKGDSVLAEDGLPPEFKLADGYVIIPENAYTDTSGNAAFSLHPVDDHSQVGGVPYAEVRGEHEWRVRLDAPSGDPKVSPPPGRTGEPQKPNAPVSYLLWVSEALFPYFELQTNEGCVRIAGHCWRTPPKARTLN